MVHCVACGAKMTGPTHGLSLEDDIGIGRPAYVEVETWRCSECGEEWRGIRCILALRELAERIKQHDQRRPTVS